MSSVPPESDTSAPESEAAVPSDAEVICITPEGMEENLFEAAQILLEQLPDTYLSALIADEAAEESFYQFLVQGAIALVEISLLGFKQSEGFARLVQTMGAAAPQAQGVVLGMTSLDKIRNSELPHEDQLAAAYQAGLRAGSVAAMFSTVGTDTPEA